MKTLRIALLILLGSFFTFQSYAQEVKKESKAKFRMEVIDADGNKKIVDTTFTVSEDEDLAQNLKELHRQLGIPNEEFAALKEEFKALALHFNKGDFMFDKDSLNKKIFIVQERMESGREKMEQALLELSEEIKSLEMNEMAMKKFEKAMQEFHKMDWEAHARHLKENMPNIQFFKEENVDVFNKDGKDWVKQVWVDDDGNKKITIRAEVDMDKDSLLGEYKKDSKHHLMKYKHNGNVLFFGDDDDLEVIEKGDGDQRVIIRKIRGEADKGDAQFFSDDAHVVKEFKDKDGRVKVIEYTTTIDDNDTKDLNVWVNADGKRHFLSDERKYALTSATKSDIDKAQLKAVLNSKNELTELSNLSIDIDNDIVSVGTQFDKKKKLDIQLFDADFNPLWESKEGKVVGEWSATLPADKLKENGTYFVLINHGNKSHLLNLLII